MKKDWVARQLKAEVIVGAFILLVFIGLGYFTIILSEASLFRPRHHYEVVFKNVMGLREGDGVVVRGTTLGKVRELNLMTNLVHVNVALDQSLHLREGYRIRIVPTSVLGGHYLEIDEGPETNAPLERADVLQGQQAVDLISDATDLVNALRQGMVEGGMIDNLRITSEKVRLISERIESGEGSLGKLVSKDETLYTNLLATAESLKNIAGRLEAGEGLLGRLLTKEDPLYDDIAATAHSLRVVSEKLENGDGVIGKLLSDEKLGTQVGEIITEARAMVDDMRESTPVVTFTSIFFGAF